MKENGRGMNAFACPQKCPNLDEMASGFEGGMFVVIRRRIRS